MSKYIAPPESIPHNMDAETLDYVMGIEAAWERSMVESTPARLPRRTARVRRVAHWAILSLAALAPATAQALPRDPAQDILLAVVRAEMGLGQELSCAAPFTLEGELRGCETVDTTVRDAGAERRAEAAEERAAEREEDTERWAIRAIVEDAEEMGADPSHEIDRWYARRGYARKAAERARKGADWEGPREVNGDTLAMLDSTPWGCTSWGREAALTMAGWCKGRGFLTGAGPNRWDHEADVHLAEMAAIRRAEDAPVPEVHGEHLRYLWRQSHTRQTRLEGLLRWVATAKLADLYRAARGKVFENRRLDSVARAVGWPCRPKVQGPWPTIEGHPVVGMTRVYKATLKGTRKGVAYEQTVRVVRWPDWSNVYLTKEQSESLLDALYTAIANIERAPRKVKAPTAEDARVASAKAKAGKLFRAIG